jgi:hypothetical protein
MLKSILKPIKNYGKSTININKNITNLVIILLVLVMILIIFWNIFNSIFDAMFSKEGLDPNAKPPINVPLSVSITDNTKSSEQIDPNAAGTFYLTSVNNMGKLNIINMGADPSNNNIKFDGGSNTKLLIYPTGVPQTNPHKSNIFPVSFTIDISLVNLNSTLNTKYTDISGDDYRNTIQYYRSPNNDVSGNFANIVVAVPNVQTPIFISNNSEIDVGYVSKPSTNEISINIDHSGNLIDGFVLFLNPPT